LEYRYGNYIRIDMDPYESVSANLVKVNTPLTVASGILDKKYRTPYPTLRKPSHTCKLVVLKF
jgi:hypothetical protein